MSSAPVCPRAPTMPSLMVGSAMGMTLQFLLQARFHRRPLTVQGREAHAVAQAAIAMAQVLAQDAFLLCAQPRDRRARGRVVGAGVEADAGAAQRLERVPEQQQLEI